MISKENNKENIYHKNKYCSINGVIISNKILMIM